MFSRLRKKLVYEDVSEDIVESDEDMEAEMWSYNGKEVYRGTFDPRYTINGLDVYWLYSEDLKRVGLVEHEVSNPAIFEVLWIKEDPFSTLFQEEWTTENKSVWDLLSAEAFEDCLENPKLLEPYLITPQMLMKDRTLRDNKKNNYYFITENYIIFTEPKHVSYEKEQE